MEIDLINRYNSTNRNFGYNIQLGGSLGNRKNASCYRYDLFGNFIDYWDDIYAASDELNIPVRDIRTVCEGQQQYCANYIFRYEPDSNIVPLKNAEMRYDSVLQYDRVGNFIYEYKNIYEASKMLGIKSTELLKCCKEERTTAMGYYWFLNQNFSDEKLHDLIMQYKDMSTYEYLKYGVKQYDLMGNYIATYRDFIQIKEKFGFNSSEINCCLQCAKKIRKSFANYIWIFDKERSDRVRPILYLQSDKKWANNDYSAKGEKTTIKAEGCGIACSAMVIATFADGSVTPADTARWSLENGFKAKGQGTYYAYFKPQFAEYGLKCHMVNSKNCYHDPKAKCHKEAINAIDNGDIVIACMGKGNWTTSGHYIVWYGMEGNNVLINDPWSVKKQQTNASYDLFRNEVKYYWIISVPDKYKEDGEVVTEDVIMIDGKEYKIEMIRKDGYTYLNTRQLCEILGYNVDSEGRIPIVKTDK